MKPYFLNSQFNHSIYYYMQISKNDVVLQDSKLYGSPTNTYYLETRVDYNIIQQMINDEGAVNAYIGVYI